MLKTTRTKLKILFVLHYPNPFPGGGWTRISFLAKFLKDRGHDVSINGAFSLKTLNKFGIKNWNGLKLYNITPIMMINNTLPSILNILSSILTSFFIIIFKRPDIIVISVPRGETAIGSCLIALAFKKKIIIDYRDEWEDYQINSSKTRNSRFFYKSLKKQMTKFNKRCNHVITTTEHMMHNLSKRGITNVKLFVNGADIKIFKPYDMMELRRTMRYDENDFIFVYSGKIGDYYRVDLVVKAIEVLIQKKKNVKLLLVGSGPYVKELKNIIKKNNLQKNIIYLGEINEKIDLAKLLSVSNVGIIPYDANLLWKNTIPSKALEYFACGLPVVATCYTDSILGKIINENQIGFVVEPENVSALTNSLEKIYSDKQFLNKAHLITRKLIEDRFDRNKIAIEFLKLLEE